MLLLMCLDPKIALSTGVETANSSLQWPSRTVGNLGRRPNWSMSVLLCVRQHKAFNKAIDSKL